MKITKPDLSMTLRLTLSFVLILTLACAGVSWTLYRALRNELTWRDDMTLVNRAGQLRQLLADGAKPEDLPLYFNRMMDTRQDILLIESAGADRVSVNHTGIDGTLLNALPALKNPTIKAIARSQIAGTPFSAIRLTASSQHAPVTVTVARLSLERQHMLAQYRYHSIIICLLALLVCSALSPFLIKRGLRAIKTLSQQTAGIDSRGLSQPLAVQDLPAELKPLGHALNVMRQKLADDFTRLNQFADDLAHELRTPVNILLGHNQVVLNKERRVEEYQQALASNIEELERMARLTENILFLARAEHHNIMLQKEPVPHGELIGNLIEFLQYDADEKNTRFTVACSGTVEADRLLLQRVLLNLLSNAIRYSAENSVIRITSTTDERGTTIEFTNPGQQFAAPGKLFDRFWREDNARQSTGYGLGLSMVKAIMELHTGEVGYRFADGRHTFFIRFPSPAAATVLQ
ncbi:TPA: heavy metal sensor histidine kinase [Citrobacter freundii]